MLVLLDQVIPYSRQAAMPSRMIDLLEKYSYVNGRGERILCWDHSRFVNHSCDPTSLAPGLDLEIAVRDIQAGEEITDDYAALNIEAAFPCRCVSRQCRGVISPGDFERHAGKWDALLDAAFRQIDRVEQPLWNLVAQKTEILRMLATGAPVPSCRFHYWEGLNGRR